MRLTFDRIGRSHDVAPLELDDDLSGDAIAEAVYRYARPFLVSRDVEVFVDLEQGRGGILCGFQSGGSFTVEPSTLARTREPADARGDS